MRIITGKYKKSNLFAVPGRTARPTTDFTREVIFTVLESCQNLQVLDIYAGSGSLGLEALSRGARFVDFVDFSEKSIRTIIKNVHKLGCKLDCKIHRKKVSAYLKSCNKKFDIILMDPPYDRKLVNKTIKHIFENELLKENGKIVVEHSSREKIDAIWQENIDYQRDGKKTKITILKNMNYSEEEKDIIESLENNEWKSIGNLEEEKRRSQEIAKNTIRKKVRNEDL